MLFFITFLLIGCSKNVFNYYMDSYIEEQDITNIEEIMFFEDEPNIKGAIFKGAVDGTENLYYYEGLSGSKEEGVYANGEYTGNILQLDEGMRYDIHKREDYGYDKSYFVGIAYRKMKGVYCKDESVNFKTVDVSLNDKKQH